MRVDYAPARAHIGRTRSLSSPRRIRVPLNYSSRRGFSAVLVKIGQREDENSPMFVSLNAMGLPSSRLREYLGVGEKYKYLLLQPI